MSPTEIETKAPVRSKTLFVQLKQCCIVLRL